MSTPVSLLLVVLLVLLNGFFVAAELVIERRPRARGVQKALGRLDTYIAATQLGITMASLALGFIGEPALAHLVEPLTSRFLPESGATITAHGLAVIIAFTIATALHIVFGELAPKSIALQRPEQTSLWVTAPLDLFLKAFRPFIYVLNGIGNGVVRLLGFEPAGEHALVHSVEELELIVRSSREAGVVDAQQEYMVAGVFEFAGSHAREIMTPRTEIEAVPVGVSLGELARHASEGSHSRLPIYDGDLDHIVGVVHVKDVLRALRLQDVSDDAAPFDVRSIKRRVLFVAESLPLDRLMAQLRHARLHLAVVVDEFGGTAGLVTFEDLLEEIVGDVADEFDTGRAQIEEHPDGRIELDGLLSVDEVNERFHLEIVEEFYDTIGGHVFGILQRPPQIGDEVQVPTGRVLRVTALDERRIARLLLLPRPSSDGEESEVETAPDNAETRGNP
jgi:putative hemolysin